MMSSYFRKRKANASLTTSSSKKECTPLHFLSLSPTSSLLYFLFVYHRLSESPPTALPLWRPSLSPCLCLSPCGLRVSLSLWTQRSTHLSFRRRNGNSPLFEWHGFNLAEEIKGRDETGNITSNVSSGGGAPTTVQEHRAPRNFFQETEEEERFDGKMCAQQKSPAREMYFYKEEFPAPMIFPSSINHRETGKKNLCEEIHPPELPLLHMYYMHIHTGHMRIQILGNTHFQQIQNKVLCSL